MTDTTVTENQALPSLRRGLCAKFILAALFVFSVSAFAQEYEEYDEYSEEEEEAAPAPALPKPAASVAQMLSGTSLSKGCVADFTNLFEKSGFSITNFAKELPPAIAKTKLQLKAPLGKPKDSDMTSAGLTVGCIRTLPESPAEMQSLLKDISLKAGLDFAESSIPTNIDTDSDSGGGAFKTVVSVSLISGGLGTLVCGFMQNGEVSDAVSKKNGKAALDAENSRNMSYGIGTGLLAGGLVITVFF
ncbi:MAG: hypothetical protein LBH25_07940 [Fibromonadaceae bacterium]|jgi:hypothetical protein|nr:hypothetical protein [Fibromonadaceae bacterium]